MDFDKDLVFFNKIIIFFDFLFGDVFYGYSVVVGNERLFFGFLMVVGDLIKVVVSEFGDDRYDGVFIFIIWF